MTFGNVHCIPLRFSKHIFPSNAAHTARPPYSIPVPIPIPIPTPYPSTFKLPKQSKPMPPNLLRHSNKPFPPSTQPFTYNTFVSSAPLILLPFLFHLVNESLTKHTPHPHPQNHHPRPHSNPHPHSPPHLGSRSHATAPPSGAGCRFSDPRCRIYPG